MDFLIAGIVLFLGAHSLKIIWPVRKVVAKSVGEKSLKKVLGLLSLVGLVLISVGLYESNSLFSKYDPPSWGLYAAWPLMWLSMILFAGANMPSNVNRYTALPMTWGTLAWAVAHLLGSSSGSAESLYLFGSFAVWAVLVVISSTLRGTKKTGKTYPVSKDIKLAAIAAATTILLAAIHYWVFDLTVLPV